MGLDVTAPSLYGRPRNLSMATFRGRVYRSTGIRPDGTVRLFFDSIAPPEDDEFTRHPNADVWIRVVSAADCDRVVQVVTSARYGRYECQVANISEDGMALLFSAKGGPDFEMIEPGSYQKAVHINELRDYHEIHLDLLFNYWRDRVGGGGSQVRP
jgi:hypothetical protein